MKTDSYKIWAKHEYSYPMAFGFIPNLVSYLHDEDELKPCMIIAPGGGYRTVSPNEGELVAGKFYSKGYNVFILTYTTNLLATEPLRLQPLKDISRAVRFIRLHAVDFNIDADKLVLCGFSAGGHLCASLSVHYMDINDTGEYSGVPNRPDAAILSYPVITAGEKGHGNSFTSLFGNNASAEELDYMSLEKHVDKDTPPCFLWHTATDELVPVENSLLFAEACKNMGVNYALHIFSDGPHGLSLADNDWASENWGADYMAEQRKLVIDKIKSGEIELTDEAREAVDYFENPDNESKPVRRVYDEITLWPDLAAAWLSGVLK